MPLYAVATVFNPLEYPRFPFLGEHFLSPKGPDNVSFTGITLRREVVCAARGLCVWFCDARGLCAVGDALRFRRGGLVACARIVCRRGRCHAFDHGLKG